MSFEVAHLDSMHQFFQQLYGATLKMLPKVKFDKADGVHRTLMSLYASIIEQADSAMTLRQQGKSPGVEMILRASLEAHIDLINLANDRDYIKQMMFSYHKEWIKLAGDGVAGDNPFLIYFKDNPEAVAQFEKHKVELAALKAEIKPLHIDQKFELANMGHIYRSIYNSLCNESHNNIRALTSRHFRVDEETGKAEIVIFDPMTPIDEAAVLDAYIAILNMSNYIIHHYFKSEALPEVQEFQKLRNDKGVDWSGTAA